MKDSAVQKKERLSRRNFIKTSGVVGATAMLAGTGRMFAAGSDKIRVGVIGCGGRGTYDTTNCLKLRRERRACGDG